MHWRREGQEAAESDSEDDEGEGEEGDLAAAGAASTSQEGVALEGEGGHHNLGDVVGACLDRCGVAPLLLLFGHIFEMCPPSSA